MGISPEMLALGLFAVFLGLVLYWIFVAPERAKKRRREALAGSSYSRAWDPDITSRRRDR